MPSKKSLIAGLVIERAGLVRVGLHHRVREIDAELARLGHGPAQAGQPPAVVNGPAELMLDDGTRMELGVKAITAARPETATTAQPETTQQAAPEHTAAPSPTDHRCDICGRSFKSAAGLGSHRRHHKDDGAEG